MRRLLTAVGAFAAGLAVASAPAAPVRAASEVINPPVEIMLQNADGGTISGDLPMPSCGSKNITGDNGFARWKIKSSLGPNSVIFPGMEWEVSVSMYGDHLDAAPWKYNDGPDPLIVSMPPAGPVERVQIVPTMPAHLENNAAYHGDSWVGPLNAIQTWGYAFDSNSEPTLDGVLQEPSDGVDLTLKIRMRATAPGAVTIPALVIKGWDSTPKGAPVGCIVPLNWLWTVTAFDKPIVKGEAVKTDASYSNLDPGQEDDENWGIHGIEIDVLANDDDANTPGGVGDTDDVRLESWSVNTDQGGTLDCGLASAFPEDVAFEDLSAGPCTYTPPDNFPPGNVAGTDVFHYTVRQRSDGSTAEGTVKISVVPNRRPLTEHADLYATVNVDDTFDLSGHSVDLGGDEVTCLSDLVSDPAPPIGAVTMHPDCTFDWDTGGGQGNVLFTYRVCDTHALLTDHGPNATKIDTYANGDLTATTARRCTDATARLIVNPGILILPTGKPDFDVVDAGYSGEGIGAYTIEVPVLANDYDNNGPAPTDGYIADGPEPAEGTATWNAGVISFTPADGFSGPVVIEYATCEDPDVQDPPYEGLGFCGLGLLKIEVIGNPAPEPADDFAVAVAPNGTIVDRDVSANDVDAEGEVLGCDSALVGVDPAFIASAHMGFDCLLDVDPVDGVTGSTSFTYRVCDSHLLADPTWNATPYGTDGRAPFAVAGRCSTAEVEMSIIQPLVIDPEEVPQVDDGPEGPPDDIDPTLPPDATVPPVDATAGGGEVTPPTTEAMQAPNPAELPRTGGGSIGIVVLGAALIAFGAVIVQITRRRGTV